jgi:SagB-type dehydrogenase family enzyme
MKKNTNRVFINSHISSSVDPEVYQDVCKTFAKETISFMKYGNLSATNVNLKVIERVEHTETEISPFHKNDIDCSAIKSTSFNRQSSTSQFIDKKIDFLTVQKILVDSFSPGESGSRPYPSAGGLYPVEPLIFLFDDKMNEFNGKYSGCYHYRTLSQKLQFIKEMNSETFNQKILHGFTGDDPARWPSFAILYMAHIAKSIFKYRNRGYRHAVLEAGSMYQHATMISQQNSLNCVVWSAFSEQQMLYELGLEHHTYFPLIMQLFGYGKPNETL